jgi:DNA polymerase-3 subunit alpha
VAKGVQPIIGCQISLTRPEQPGLPPDPVVLLAQTQAGLANLQHLSSDGFLLGDGTAPPQVSFDAVSERADGLFLLTGGTRGPLGRLLGEGREADAAAMLARMQEAFGDRMAVELHRHNTTLDRALEPGLITLADRRGLPLVASNECFFDTPGMYEAHDALMCIAESRLLADAERRRVTPEHWFKPAAAMRMLFADLPDA